MILDLTTVIRDRARDRQFAGRDVRQRSAPAVTHCGNAARVFDHVDASGEIEHRFLVRNLQPIAAALLDFRFAVPELDAAADAIEQTGSDGDVTVGREAVRDPADVPVHAENFLGEKDDTARRAAGRGEPRVEFVAVARHESRELTHVAAPVRQTIRREEGIVPPVGRRPALSKVIFPAFVLGRCP